MNANKYAIISLVLGLAIFFGTFFAGFNHSNAVISGGWVGVLLALFYGGLFWIGIFLFLVGLLMLLL